MRGSSSDEMPTPVSRTVTVAAPVERSCTETRTLPPRAVNLSALATRLATACPTSAVSWRTSTLRVGMRSSTATPARRAPAAACSTANCTLARMSATTNTGRAIPASNRESSRMFDVSESIRSSCRPASMKSFFRVASSVPESCSKSTNARNAASGVRSSCETSARCSCPRSRSRRSACIEP